LQTYLSRHRLARENVASDVKRYAVVNLKRKGYAGVITRMVAEATTPLGGFARQNGNV
jgi:hypothetical protein